MLRLLFGFAKGAAIGGGVGYAAYAAGIGGGLAWLVYGIIGLLVGALVGRPLWVHLRDRGATIWTPALKGLVGFGVAVGLYALVSRVNGGFSMSIGGEVVNVVALPYVVGAAIGGLYGAFVEVDDSVSDKSSAGEKES